jgi:hypothetical protein
MHYPHTTHILKYWHKLLKLNTKSHFVIDFIEMSNTLNMKTLKYKD